MELGGLVGLEKEPALVIEALRRLYTDLLIESLSNTIYGDPPFDPWSGKAFKSASAQGRRGLVFSGPRDCKVANYLRIWAAPRKLSANGSTLFANGESRSVMICGWGTLFMQ
jgi:hypothetical protein